MSQVNLGFLNRLKNLFGSVDSFQNFQIFSSNHFLTQ